MSPEAADYGKRALRALATAKQVLANDPDATASRAYYAAFYAVSALFAAEGKSYARHTGVETAVHRDLVKAGRIPKELGAYYSYLFELRATGDYGGAMHVTPDEATEAVGRAERIIEAVRGLAPGAFPG